MDSNSEVSLNLKYSDKIIKFLINNRDVAPLILDFFQIENKIKNAENLILTSEKLNYFENVKKNIVNKYHNCRYLLPIKKILEKVIYRYLGKKKKKKLKKVKEIYWFFKKTNYKNRKIDFYKIAKTEIEKLLVAINQEVSDYVLIDGLRFSLLLLDKIIQIYEKKKYYLWYADNYIEEILYETSSVVSVESYGNAYYDSWGGEEYDWND